MLSIKPIHKLFALAFLLLTLVSFSGFTNQNTYNQKAQTELVTQVSKCDAATVLYSDLLSSTSQKVIFNQYLVFNFRSLLIFHEFDLEIIFKTQKVAILEFMDVNDILGQNLIAQSVTDDQLHPCTE